MDSAQLDAYKPRTANIIGMLESARKEKRAFAAGGYNGSPLGVATVIKNNFDIATLVEKLDKVQQALQNQQVIFFDVRLMIIIDQRKWPLKMR